ncbi:MAG: inner membrane CreD family protein, partial [Polyangiales bacterium]
RSVVQLQAPWPDPSFNGSWLPQWRRVDDTGFSVRWDLSYFGRNYPQLWTEASSRGQSPFGVDLLQPVDPYRMAERSRAALDAEPPAAAAGSAGHHAARYGRAELVPRPAR